MGLISRYFSGTHFLHTHHQLNKDGFIDEWPEMGFVSMHSPYDPKPSVKIEDGIITELDGKKRDEFDFLDQFIADYAIRADRAEASMAIPSLEIARKIVDIHVSRKEILEIVSGITPAKMVEVINYLNVVELMMGMQKMRARKVPGNQAHITEASKGSLCCICCDLYRIPDRSSGCPDAVFCGRGNGNGTWYPRPDNVCRNTFCIWYRESIY